MSSPARKQRRGHHKQRRAPKTTRNRERLARRLTERAYDLHKLDLLKRKLDKPTKCVRCGVETEWQWTLGIDAVPINDEDVATLCVSCANFMLDEIADEAKENGMSFKLKRSAEHK